MDHSRAELELVFQRVSVRAAGPEHRADGRRSGERRIIEARERGIATSDEEMEPGLVAAAAPVRDAHGRIVAALNVSGPSSSGWPNDSMRRATS